MNSCGDKGLYPAQVYAQFTSSGGETCSPFKDKKKNTSNIDNQVLNVAASQEEIHIYESGEVTLPPDHVKVVIVCSNTKETAEEVKASVTKRVEYILQTFRSQNIAKNCYTVDKSLRRQEQKYFYCAEIVVRFADFNKCQNVTNFLVEKLDTSVNISSPIFHFAPGKLESLRRQACLLAVHNAKVKALEIASSFNQTLGRARQIYEESTEEYTGSSDLTEADDRTFQQLVRSASVTAVTKISVSFELKGKVKQKKQH